MRLVLIASGAVGFGILARAMILAPTVGAEGDALARGLFGVMALALAAGLAELWVRQRRAETGRVGLAELAERLKAGDTRATEADLSTLAGAVTSRIRSRVERHPVPAGTMSLTPHIAGLLIALGGLGGFLGLIETLAGAEVALTAGGGFNALRAALAGPVLGLADSLEMTFAGVAAAALLGLASVGVRRAEHRLSGAADDFAAGPHAPISGFGDQLALLQLMVQQGQALPAAAQSLQTLSSEIRTLQTAFAEAQEKSSRDTLIIVRDAVVDFRSDMKHAVEESARIAKEAVSPLFEDAVERTVKAATTHLDRVVESLERDFAGRRTSESEFATRLDENARALVAEIGAEREQRGALEAQLGERWAAHETRLAGIGEGLGENVRAARALVEGQAELGDRLEAALEARTRGVLERLSDVAADLQATGERQLSGIAGYVEQAETRAMRAEADANARLDSLLEAVGESAQAQSRQLTELDAQRAEAGRAQIERLAEGLDRHAERLAAELNAAGGLVREAAALVQAGGAEMSGVAEMFGNAVDRQRDAASAWIEGLGAVESTLAGAVEQAGRDAAADALRDQLSSTHELFGRQLEFQRELFEQLRTLRGAPYETESLAAAAADDAPTLEREAGGEPDEAPALEPAPAAEAEVTPEAMHG